MCLRKTVAIVAGDSGRIGEAIANEFAREVLGTTRFDKRTQIIVAQIVRKVSYARSQHDTLVTAHQCENCQRAFAPKQMNEDASVTGLFVCPVCGHAGPLRIVVVPLMELSSS